MGTEAIKTIKEELLAIMASGEDIGMAQEIVKREFPENDYSPKQYDISNLEESATECSALRVAGLIILELLSDEKQLTPKVKSMLGRLVFKMKTAKGALELGIKGYKRPS